ncbi:GNAT family N-acetyltransferase, partial [Polaribacter sp.]|nr:GNAT family N-acetyltransferase [Polaribacter sp.]
MAEIEICSERVKLRLIELSDLETIHNLHSLPETDKYNALGIPKNIEETSAIITSWIKENQLNEIKNYTFAIDDKFNKEFIGLFGLKLGNKKYNRAEVWYKIHSDYWNKGYAT